MVFSFWEDQRVCSKVLASSHLYLIIIDAHQKATYNAHSDPTVDDQTFPCFWGSWIPTKSASAIFDWIDEFDFTHAHPNTNI